MTREGDGDRRLFRAKSGQLRKMGDLLVQPPIVAGLAGQGAGVEVAHSLSLSLSLWVAASRGEEEEETPKVPLFRPR